MATWVHQTHIRKARPMSLSNTSDPRIMQSPHLDGRKGGTPNAYVFIRSSGVYFQGSIGNKPPTLSLGLQLSSVPILDMTHLNFLFVWTHYAWKQLCTLNQHCALN
jgi:hypothetical protein